MRGGREGRRGEEGPKNCKYRFTPTESTYEEYLPKIPWWSARRNVFGREVKGTRELQFAAGFCWCLASVVVAYLP